MWAEARKHEKKLKGLMIDYRRRAERRREFYDRIRLDPAAFLQIHGNQMKVHIDPNLCSAAESSLMPWMGDSSNLIDRFDVRAHLDRLDIVNNTTNTTDTTPVSAAEEALERQINYERFRNLVQNEFLALNESKFLQQIWFEERFGVNHSAKEDKNKPNPKKKLAEKKATIAYNYDNDDINSQTVQTKNSESSDSEESSDEDYDFDTTVNIDQLDNESGHRINSIALKFGMKNDDFVKYLDEDKTEAEKIRVQKEIENEKSMFTGRKSRRERRALKEQRLMILRAANVEDSDKFHKKIESEKQSQSSSDSEVSVDETKIEFITSFGGSSEEDNPKEEVQKKQKQSIAKKKQRIKALINQKAEAIPIVYGPTLPGEDSIPSTTNTSFNKSNHSKQRTYRFNDTFKRSRTRSRSHSTDRYKYRRTESRHYSRRNRSRTRSPEPKRSSNRTPDRYRDRKRSRSRERNRFRTRSRSRSRSRNRNKRRSRSHTPKRGRSRSLSRNKRTSRRRSRSRDRRDRSHSKRRSRSIRRSRSRDKDRVRDQNIRNKQKSSHERSRSKSQHKKCFQQFVAEDKSVPIIEKTIESANESVKIEPKDSENGVKATNDGMNFETLDSYVENEPLKEETAVKAPSPPVRSYYRHDLCESGESDVEVPQKDRNQTEKDEGSKKRSNVSNLNSGHKSSLSSATITPQERLKKKRQALIDKQYKLDKKAELQKLEKLQQEREVREEELREMTSKLKNRRDLHRDHRSSRSSSSSGSTSSSSSSSH